jgi:hypothetical protein
VFREQADWVYKELLRMSNIINVISLTINDESKKNCKSSSGRVAPFSSASGA